MSRPGTPKEHLDFIQNEHPPVVKAKRKVIEELLGQFLLHHVAKEKEQAGKPDFIAYLKDLSPKLPELLPDLLKDALSPKSEAPLREVLHFANFGYVPPADSVGLINDLWLLYTYWNIWPASRMLLSKEAMEGDWGSGAREPFEGFEDILDLSLAKFAFKIGIEISGTRHWGMKLEAIARLNLKKRCEKEVWRGMIYSAFANVRKAPGDTFNCIVGRIYKSLQKNEQPKKPSKKTIGRALKDNHQLMGECFYKAARGDKSRFLYIGQTGV